MEDRVQQNSSGFQHRPVLHNESLDILAPKPGETILDCTVGLGGHAESFLKAVSPDGKFIGFDADEGHYEKAKKRLASFGNRVELLRANFRELSSRNLPPVDVVFADLGLCSAHVDDPERGFSFRFDGPLDLRFDTSHGKSAADMLASMSVEEVDALLREYGELTRLGRLASLIVEKHPLTTTALRECVEEAYGFRAKQVLPQVFQAIRIAVNDELGALETLLTHGPELLKPGGRMGIISYHSLEDRPVKRCFRDLSTPTRDSLTGRISVPASFSLLTPRPIRPSEEEITENPRARSALLRVLRKES